jgi:hypothetical protein
VQSLSNTHRDLSRLVARLNYRDDPTLRQQLMVNTEAYADAATTVAPDLCRLRSDDDHVDALVSQWVDLSGRLRENAANYGTVVKAKLPDLLEAVINAEAEMTRYLAKNCDDVRLRVCAGRFEREQSSKLSELLNRKKVATA